MDRSHSVVNCKCGSKLTVSFEGVPAYSAIPMTCKKCGSDVEVQCKPALRKGKVQLRVKLIKHTQKLLDMLGIDG